MPEDLKSFPGIQLRLKEIVEKFNKSDLGELIFITAVPMTYHDNRLVAKYRGVYVAPIEKINGLGNYNDVVTRKSFGKDVEIIEIGKFFRECLDGNLSAYRIVLCPYKHVNEKYSEGLKHISELVIRTISTNINSWLDKEMKKTLASNDLKDLLFASQIYLWSIYLNMIVVEDNFSAEVINCFTTRPTDLVKNLDKDIQKIIENVSNIDLTNYQSYTDLLKYILDLDNHYQKARSDTLLPLNGINEKIVLKFLILFRHSIFENEHWWLSNVVG